MKASSVASELWGDLLYLDLMAHECAESGVAVWAWCLLPALVAAVARQLTPFRGR